MRRALTTVAAVLVAAAAAAGPALAADLTLTQSSGAKFPARSFVLSSTNGLSVTPQQITVTENGQPVRALSVQSANSVGQGEFGTVLLIADGMSMRGARINAALTAARTFLKYRNTQQPLGIIFFNASQTVAAPLTTDTSTLEKALAAPPGVGPGRHVFDGATAALQMLQQGGVKHGTIILLSDGQDTGSRTAQETVASTALAEGVHFYGIGVLAPNEGNNLHSLAAATQGEYRTVASGDLAALYQRLGTSLSDQYVIRYQSSQRLGQAVTVTASVASLGAATLTYTTPALTVAPVKVGPQPHTFITSSGFETGLVIGFALLVGFAVFVLSRHRAAVSSRVSDYVASGLEAPAQQFTLAERALGDKRGRSIRRSPLWTILMQELDIGNVAIAPQQIVLGTVLATVGLALLLAKETGSPIAVALAALVPVGAFMAIRAAADRQRRMFGDQLPDNLQIIASSMRAGNTFMGAMSVVVEDAPEPSRRELRRALTDEQLGVPLAEALDGVTKRMKSDDFHHVAIVAALQRDAGGNTAEVVDLVTETVRERIELRRMVRALTAQGRLAGAVLTVLPGAILALVSVINPDYVHPLFHSTTGLVAVGVGGGMTILGSYVINRIVNIEV